MKLITKELENRFAEIGSQSDELDPIVVAKFFLPWAGSIWFVTEYTPDRNICFGYIVDSEFGDLDGWYSFSLDEFKARNEPLNCHIRRDLDFTEQRFIQAVGKVYFERHFPDKAKEQAEPQKVTVDDRMKKRLDSMKRARAKQRDKEDDIER